MNYLNSEVKNIQFKKTQNNIQGSFHKINTLFKIFELIFFVRNNFFLGHNIDKK